MNSRHLKYSLIFILSGIIIVLGCKKEPKEDTTPASTFPGFRKPGHFPDINYALDANPVTHAGYELGRKLFYDPVLSFNSTISCGSCHLPTDAFSQSGHDISHGVLDRVGRRNSPALMNMAWSTSFFFDGGVVDLDLQPIQPITAHEEMAEDMALIPAKLAANPAYAPMFENAFNSPGITNTRMLKALSQFMVMLVSSNAKYDSVKTGSTAFTSAEQAGYLVFQSKCASCHKEPLFTDFSFRNNGLPATIINDKGRAEITSAASDLYKFKVPSLRNLRYTAPYMHDGRMTSLDQVLDHYTSILANEHGTLDPILNNPGAPGVALTEGEREALLSFLHTLNDRPFVVNPLFAEP